MLLIVMVAMVTILLLNMLLIVMVTMVTNFVCMISSEILMIETWDKFFLVTQDNV